MHALIPGGLYIVQMLAVYSNQTASASLRCVLELLHHLQKQKRMLSYLGCAVGILTNRAFVSLHGSSSTHIYWRSMGLLSEAKNKNKNHPSALRQHFISVGKGSVRADCLELAVSWWHIVCAVWSIHTCVSLSSIRQRCSLLLGER